METKTQNLSSGLEDYMEAIYIAHLEDTPLKGAELARRLNISRASVSEALNKLANRGLIKYNSYKAISITKSGIYEAKKVYDKHKIIKDFLEQILNIPTIEASENACKIEHIISENILNRMNNFTTFCQNHQDFITAYKKEYSQND